MRSLRHWSHAGKNSYSFEEKRISYQHTSRTPLADLTSLERGRTGVWREWRRIGIRRIGLHSDQRVANVDSW